MLASAQKSVPELIRLLSKKDYFAADALSKISSKTLISELIKMLASDDKETRQFAVHFLGVRLKSRMVLPAMLKLLNNEKSLIRLSAVKVIKKLDDKKARPGLMKLLNDPDEFVRAYAVITLGRFGVKQVTPLIKPLLSNKDDEVRCDAITAITKTGARLYIPNLIKALEDSDKWVRWVAIMALTDFGVKEIIPRLIKFLAVNEDRITKTAALDALAKLGARESIPAMIKLLDDEYVAVDAVNALAELDAQEAVPGIIKLLASPDWRSPREECVVALKKLGAKKTEVPVLIKMLDNPNVRIRRDAIAGLGLLRAKEAIPVLKAHLYDADRMVCLLTIASLFELRVEIPQQAIDDIKPFAKELLEEMIPTAKWDYWKRTKMALIFLDVIKTTKRKFKFKC
ncbi:MAG: HEAT repeat domain-containing protein [Planctomycetes bacterium]|nr:HEAT repeat domain-containing protein [Planctomycetota bacterium]